VALGEITQLHAWGELSYPMYEEVGASIWESLQPGIVAAYSNGQIIGLSPGVATIRATIRQEGGDVSETYDVTVLSTPVQPPLKVAVGTRTGPWRLGESAQVGASAIYSDRENPIAQLARWSSSDPSVASVSSTGLVSIKSFGSAEISATFMGVTGTAPVNVPRPTAVEVLTASKSWFVARADFLFAYASFADRGTTSVDSPSGRFPTRHCSGLAGRWCERERHSAPERWS
jgi:hypothetical protein